MQWSDGFIDSLFRRGWRARLLRLGVFALTVLPVATAATIGTIGLHRELTERAFSRRAALANLAGNVVEERFSGMLELGKSIATRVAFRQHVANGAWAQAGAILADIPKDFPYVDRVFVTDASGTLMADAPSRPDVIGQNFSYRDWYAGVSDGWQPYASEVYVRAAEPQVHVIAFAVPISDPAGTGVNGILVLQARLSTLLDWIHGIRVGDGGFIYLVDRNAKLMTHPDMSASDRLIDYSSVPVVRTALEGGSGVAITYNTIEREERLTAYWHSERYGFAAVAQESASEAFAFRDRQVRAAIVVFSLLVLFNVFLAWMIWRLLKTMFERRRREETFLSSIGDGVVAIDRAWNITLWNPAAARLTGWQAAEVMGRPFRERVKFIREQDQQENIVFIEEAMLFGEARAMQNSTFLLTRDGREVPIGDSAAPIFGEDGAVTGVIIIFRDVSREKEAGILRTDFAYASHQFRTPLNKALWNLELALEESKTPSVREAIGIAYRSLRDTHAIAERLIEMSQIDQRMIAPRFTTASLKSVIAEAATLAKREIEERKVALRLPDLPEDATIETDPKLLAHAIGELIRNAALYGQPGGEVRVTAKTDRLETLIEVIDSGPGIPLEQQSLVFTKFFRGQNVKDDSAGAGLGLFISREYVRLLGGRLWFQSTEGSGSSFTIRLPGVRGMKL